MNANTRQVFTSSSVGAENKPEKTLSPDDLLKEIADSRWNRLSHNSRCVDARAKLIIKRLPLWFYKEPNKNWFYKEPIKKG
ncbi:MAG: hypothetical protein WCT10_02610 [Patescibacteria group bacterium]|jgi:hypothetical protein